MFPQASRGSEPGHSDAVMRGLIPPSALTVVVVRCGAGDLGAELRAGVPGRRVIGIEADERAAEAARVELDEVVVGDLEKGPPPVTSGVADVVTFGTGLHLFADPEAVLVGARDLLAPGGKVLASFYNISHHSVLRPLLRNDFMYQPHGLLAAKHLRFYSYATIFKLFLDAGYVPSIAEIVEDPVDEDTYRALVPALLHQRVDPERARRHLSASRYIVEAVPAPSQPSSFAAPMTFACLVNDTAQLESNLKRSPVFDPGSPHELILLPHQPSAADGLRSALQQASHDIVILVQQDIYLPRGWDHAFRASWEEATAQFGPLGIAGVFGLQYRHGEAVTHVGRAVDRDRLLDQPTSLPARADALDEIVLALPRSTDLDPDSSLGFHNYGSDLALQAQAKDLPVVVLDALCLHNSLFSRLDDAFHVSRERLLEKWPNQRPLCSNVGRLDQLAPVSPPVYWPEQMQRDLNRTKKQLASTRAKLRKQENRAKRTALELARLKSSRMRRVQKRLMSVVRVRRRAVASENRGE